MSVLEILRNSEHKGPALELVLQAVLDDAGFRNIRRQLSGSQFGYDLIAQRDSPVDGRDEVWVFECKNLSRTITMDDIAPKLVWHYGRAAIDRFVIVGTSPISNDLDLLLRQHQFSMQIGVWTGDTLEQLITNSPKAMKRLFPGYITDDVKPTPNIEALPFYPQNSITLEVDHQLNPPYCFDYTLVDGVVTKAFNNVELRLLVTITNPTRATLDVHSLNVITLNYQQVMGRVLRLSKMKGLFQPLELSFLPSPNAGGSKDVLGGRVWRINGGARETLALTLDRGAPPGLYQVVFSVNGKMDGRSIVRRSSRFDIHVKGGEADILDLYVFDRHYDSPAAQLLALDDSTWKRLKDETKDRNQLVFLGPSFYEISTGLTDHTWIIRACKAQPQGDGSRATIGFGEPTTEILNLGTAVDEELFSLDEIMCQIVGNDWREILAVQLKRHRKEK
ncbi:MAG TPA: hypothetical protein VGC66_19075 [Pyrinomonadaceae bacterium]|jgi:hypothetical protein